MTLIYDVKAENHLLLLIFMPRVFLSLCAQNADSVQRTQLGKIITRVFAFYLRFHKVFS